MTPAELRELQNQSDRHLQSAADLSVVPLLGQSMGAGETAQARQALGKIGGGYISNVELPKFNEAGYSIAGQFDPEMADGSLVEEDPQLRADQMEALSRLSGGLDASSQTKADAARYAALDEGNQLAQGREGAIRQQMERGGQAGNGTNALMQAQAAQMGANRARSGTMDAVHQQALERLANEQAMLGAAGQARGQDFGIKQANADTLNKFNLFNTGARNDAALRNLNTTQTINNSNVDRGDRNAQTMFGNSMQKATGQSNAIQGMSAAAGADQKTMNDANEKTTQAAGDVLAAGYKLFGGK